MESKVTGNQVSAVNKQPQKEDEIDLLKLFFAVKRKLGYVILSAFVFAAVFGAYNYFFVKQLYSATTTIMIIDSGSIVSISNLQVSNALNADYQLIVKGRQVANKVIESLQLDMDFEQLQKLVSVSNPTDTHALKITVTASTPEAAVTIANEITSISIKEIHDLLDMTEPSRVDDAALEAVKPVDKGFRKSIIIGALLGAILVIGIVVIRVIMDTTIKNEEDVEKYLDLPTLSAIPYHETKELAAKGKDETAFVHVPEKKYVRPLQFDLSFDIKESLNTLRTNMMLSGYDKKVFMFTSSIQNEGKSFVAYFLSKNMADMNKKVILIDADIRNSELRRKLGFKKKVAGLSEYLCGQQELASVIYGTDMEYLDVIFTGAQAPNPTDLFEGERFKELIDTLRQSYDYVLIDTAPLGFVIDAAIIAKNCDAAAIVVESGKDDYRNVARVKRQLEITDVDVIGVILNKVNFSKDGYGYGYGYGKYGYGYGYGYGEKSESGKKGSKKAAKPDSQTKAEAKTEKKEASAQAASTKKTAEKADNGADKT